MSPPENPSLFQPEFCLMKKCLILIVGAALLLGACSKVPFTGRKQARLLKVEEINALSFQQYDEFLQQNPPLSAGPEVRRVKAIGEKIADALEVYYKAQGWEDRLSEFSWEFNVVNDPNVNAFCMPGGKVVVYTGILPIAQDDDGLAVIMGHEIAHAVAHHGNERMSQQMGVSTGLELVGAALSGSGSQSDQNKAKSALLAAAGLGAQVGILLPFSRKHESEADQIGLYLMAIAGYNVDKAAPFWERMQAQGGETPPEFMSTHPSPETRSTNLRNWAPEAKALGEKYSLD